MNEDEKIPLVEGDEAPPEIELKPVLSDDPVKEEPDPSYEGDPEDTKGGHNE